MNERNFYKKLDAETTAWDCDAGSRRYVINNKSRRQLRKTLRKQLRKRLNNFAIESINED